MPVLRSFTEFTDEAALIGRMLAGYADLEIDLMHCVQVVRDDLDTVLKAMFRSRGETQRIDVADAFGRQYYSGLGIGAQFEMAVGDVRFCLKIRNQYAHCIWWDDNSGQLAFANLEEIAKENTPVTDLRGLTTKYVNVQLLEEQFAYFEYTDSLLIWVIQEGNALAGRPAILNRIRPAQLNRPQLFITPLSVHLHLLSDLRQQPSLGHKRGSEIQVPSLLNVKNKRFLYFSVLILSCFN